MTTRALGAAHRICALRHHDTIVTRSAAFSTGRTDAGDGWLAADPHSAAFMARRLRSFRGQSDRLRATNEHSVVCGPLGLWRAGRGLWRADDWRSIRHPVVICGVQDSRPQRFVARRVLARAWQSHTVVASLCLLECLMIKMPLSARTEFVDLVCAGVGVHDAARRVGAAGATGSKWWRQSGGMTLRASGFGGGLADRAPGGGGRHGRGLDLADRGMIQFGRRKGLSYAEIGEAIGRNKSVFGGR
jgi:hypothetical protein